MNQTRLEEIRARLDNFDAYGHMAVGSEKSLDHYCTDVRLLLALIGNGQSAIDTNQRLAIEISRLTRERDALVSDLKVLQVNPKWGCVFCNGNDELHHKACVGCGSIHNNWEWRGVKGDGDE